MLRKLTKDVVQGRSVLLIVDYNIQIKDGIPVCTYKIDQTFDTIRFITNSGCRILTISTHLGRPSNRKEYSTRPIYNYLQGIFNDIQFVTIDEHLLNRLSSSTTNNSKLMIHFTDNARYYEEETLIRFYNGYDVIVNDSFGSAHRPAPYCAYPGYLLEREVKGLQEAKKSDLVIMGGSKIKDKLRILEKFSCTVFVGGGLATTIMNSLGMVVGNRSIREEYNNRKIKDRIMFIKDELCSIPDNKIVMPVDFLTLDNSGKCSVKKYNEIKDEDQCIDVGPDSLKLLEKLLEKSTSVFWNGPLGKIEDKQATSTAKTIELLKGCNARSYVGGGETLSAVLESGDISSFRHLSTGGGAMLQFLSGESMPGIDSVSEKSKSN